MNANIVYIGYLMQKSSNMEKHKDIVFIMHNACLPFA